MTAVQSRSDSSVVSLTQYLAVVRHRWPWIVVGVLIGVCAAIGWYRIAPRTYEARATVTINPITDDLFSNTPVNQLINTATEAEVVRSMQIAQTAAADSDLPGDPRDLLNKLTVTVPPNSLALDISFEADSPERAALGANGFANAYLEFRAQVAESRRAQFVERLRDQLETLTDEFDSLRRRDARQRNILTQEIIAVREQLGTATSLPIEPGQLVTEAPPPRWPSSPNRLGVLAGGLVFGGLLGVGLALIRHRRDDRIFTTGEAAQASGLPVIGQLPALDQQLKLTRSDTDDLALTTMRLTSATFGHNTRAWVLIRADLGQPTRAETVAWRLAWGQKVSLVSLSEDGSEGTESQMNLLSELPAAPGLQFDDLLTVASEGYVILDGTGLHGLAEAIGIKGIDAILVIVELGVTRRGDVVRTIGEIQDIAPDRLTPGILVVRRRSRVRSVLSALDSVVPVRLRKNDSLQPSDMSRMAASRDSPTDDVPDAGRPHEMASKNAPDSVSEGS